MPTERDWTIRRYRAGDEQDLVALFNREFGLERSMEHWQWQFGRNPYCEPLIVVARRRADDLLVGSHVLMPVPFNLQGRATLAGHTLDLVVHRDYRRQGIFETTGRECIAWAHSLGVRVVFAFPNPNSYPGFVRSLGWARIAFLRRHQRTLGARRLGSGVVGRVLSWTDPVIRGSRRIQLAIERGLSRSARAPHLSFTVTSRVPEGQDDLWRSCAALDVLSLWKDARYLGWRYDQKPGGAFEYAQLAEGGRLAGLAVLHRVGGVTTVCEFLIRDRDLEVGRRLVAEIARRSLEQGDDRVSFFGHDRGFFADCFSGFGSRLGHANVICGAGVEDPVVDRLVAIPENWTLTYGDADYV